ncbi:hypothetical protein SAMN04488034_10915 [Salinimicrobium catena]|uniref:SIR2-like domain-containing protein n=1 Tax=Salinimicrobium catena TaxID=390640 RepID=A0A1H5P7K8_9FLAO|nr:hypothetical protein [Salinimicrobium catena]SDL72252.1 hypothetical protein SAMN04488140_10967 [Salinimicrobium catena]SEF08958.1 hypothetical protein SAMN04488034_10915 [Salinimicrobium catena]
MTHSKYNDTTNLKVTYLLGAGASYKAVPIWRHQGSSMIQVGEELVREAELKFKRRNVPGPNEDHAYLMKFANQLKYLGRQAEIFGSIDIYAKRLYLLNNTEELNNLKKCVSIYFDLWESGLLNCSKEKFAILDKRYLSLLSVLLEQNEESPRLNSNVSFITWNYDLQFEKAYETFLPEKEKSLKSIISKINYPTAEENIIHLNGYRGVYTNGTEEFEIVDKMKFSSVESYLKEILRKRDELDTTKNNFQNSIKYAWEMESDSLERAKLLMEKTDILVIIGYSFPAFNRAIDQALIKEFEKGSGYKKVIYQDPNANEDIVRSLFRKGYKNGYVKLEKENTAQFFIPHEFLSPSKGESIVI